MAPIRVEVSTPSRSYAITIGVGTLDTIARHLDELRLPERRFIVSSARPHGGQRSQ